MLSLVPKEKHTPIATDGEKACESCYTISSTRWVPWGPAHDHCRLCGHCYIYWRKYGGLKLPTKWGMKWPHPLDIYLTINASHVLYVCIFILHVTIYGYWPSFINPLEVVDTPLSNSTGATILQTPMEKKPLKGYWQEREGGGSLFMLSSILF